MFRTYCPRIDMAAHRHRRSEIRFPDTQQFEREWHRHTLYRSGKPEQDRRISGVGFIIKNTIATKFTNPSTGPPTKSYPCAFHS